MIKKTYSLVAIAALLFTASCKKETTEVQNAQTISSSKEEIKPVDPNAKYATMDFDKTEHDFGNIMQGDKVETVFTFTNNGEADLVITSAKGSCGCTVPEYPKTPIKPGASDKIKVSFNSAGKNGNQQKTVTIATNSATGKETLTIKANIKPKA